MTTGILLVTVLITDADAAGEAKTVAAAAGSVSVKFLAVSTAFSVIVPPNGAFKPILPAMIYP
jgi:hypothetical protein